jgi:hypothetical protein
MTAKKEDKTGTEEYPMGVARPAADDPTVHVEAWPEAYTNPLVEGEGEPEAKVTPKETTKDS